MDARARVEARHVEQLGHHALQALGFLADVAGDALALVDGQTLILQQLSVEVDAGKRCFQLVRYRGQEVRLHLVELLVVRHVAQGQDLAHEFVLVQGLVERHQLLHRQAVERLFAALGNAQQRGVGHGLVAAGRVHFQRGQDFAEQIVVQGHIGGRPAHQPLGLHAQQVASHRVGEDNVAVLVQQQQALVEAAHDAGGAVALGDELGQRRAAVLLQLHQHTVESPSHAPKLAIVLHRNGGREVAVGGVLQAIGKLTQRPHGGFGHAQHKHQPQQQADDDEGEQVAAGLDGALVGQLVFAGEGRGVQGHHAVGLLAQQGQFGGASLGRGPGIEQALEIGLVLRQAVHHFFFAHLGDVAGFAGKALAETRQAGGRIGRGLHLI